MNIIALVGLLAVLLLAFLLRAFAGLGWIETVLGTGIGAVVLFGLLHLSGLIDLAAFRHRLVDDVGSLWKRWSTQIASVQLTAVVAWWAVIPPEFKAATPNWVLQLVMASFAASFIFAQMFKQKNLP